MLLLMFLLLYYLFIYLYWLYRFTVCHIKPCFEHVVCPGRSFLFFIFDKCIGICGRTLDHSTDISTSLQSHEHSLLLQPNNNIELIAGCSIGCSTYIWCGFVVIPVGIVCQWRFIDPMKFIFSITVMKPNPKWCILKLIDDLWWIFENIESTESHKIGSTNVFSTSNEIGNELIRFPVLDNSQWPSKLLTFDSGFGPRSNIFWKHETIWTPFSTTRCATERGILKSNIKVINKGNQIIVWNRTYSWDVHDWTLSTWNLWQD